MKHVRTVLVFLALAACFFGCATKPRPIATGPLAGLENPSVNIMVSETKKPPLSGSFGWGYCLFKVPPDLGTDVSVIDERLHGALRSELTRKGLVFAESEPDLLVSYALAAAGEIDANELNQTYGDVLDVSAFDESTQLNYKRGVLVLDVVDRKSGHLLWRGAIMAKIDMSWPEERKQERCDAVVKALLRHYPQP